MNTVKNPNNMCSKQKTVCNEQMDFEHKINKNIIPKSNKPELNEGDNKVIEDNIAKEVNKIPDNVCKHTEPVKSTQYKIEIDLENTNLNNLSHIEISNADNIENWQNIYNEFITNTELNRFESCNYNNEVGNDNDMEILIDNSENPNVNKHLDIFNNIFEGFFAKTNIVAVNEGDLANEDVECYKNVLNEQSVIKQKLDNKETLNTNNKLSNANEFEKKQDSDCDGYNSSDFEFIDEVDATKASDFEFFLEEATINGPAIEIDIEKANIDEVFNKINSTLPNIVPFQINRNQKTMNACDEYNIINDYFESIKTALTVHESDARYGNNHRIPNEDEYISLFEENFAPYPIYSCFENKAIDFGTSMIPDRDSVGFDISKCRDKSTPKQRREAKETAQKILSRYPIENRRPRQRRY